MARLLRVTTVSLLVLFTLIFALELVIQIHPPLFPLGLSLFQKDPLCTPMDAYRGALVHCSTLQEASPESFGVATVRSEDGLQLIRTRNGSWWIPEGDDRFLPDLLSQQENSIYGRGDMGVQPGDIVLDCGAHIGLFTRQALEMGASTVVAVEISPRNIECLKRNFADEIESRRVIVYPKGVWHQDDLLTLYTSRKNSAGDSVVITGKRSSDAVQVRLTTIDKLVNELNLARIDFIKMDIKGSAPQALQGAKATLSRHLPQLAISTEEYEDHPDRIAKVISSFNLGYEPLCGTCTVRPGYFSWKELVVGMRDYRVYPLVLFFSPPS
jgi:FkbM family methyltransferase